MRSLDNFGHSIWRKSISAFVGKTADAINDSGTVVGYSSNNGNSPFHPFLYSNGKMTDLNSYIVVRRHQ
ncbi:hypothetical protein [Nostoc sp.]|uniref:hypothetical protein n=1 Tax=Nostoc sp. TaxID=1180 RepID=UPI003FA5E514